MSPQAVAFLTRCMANIIDSICCPDLDRRLAQELYNLLAPLGNKPRYTIHQGPTHDIILDKGLTIATIRRGSSINPQQLCETLNK